MSGRDRPSVGSVAGTVSATGKGRVCPGCGRPVALCICRGSQRQHERDATVHVRREVEPRSDGALTTISRVPLPEAELRALAGELGRACGSDASVVSGVIQIHGDHQTVVARALEGRGYTVEID